MTSGRWAAGLLLVSAALLAYELLLMRLLALAYWGHFAGLVIAIAMLGIASSGLFLFFARKQVTANARGHFAVSAGIFGIAAPLTFLASQQLPFTPFLLTWSAHEYALLAGRSFLFFAAFFLGGIAIGTPFVARVLPMGRLYFWNMLGSGLPALPLLFAMNFMHPQRLLAGVAATATAASLMATRKRAAQLALVGAGVAVIALVALVPFRYSEYKDLAKALLLPEAKILGERYGWDAVVQTVESPHTRYLPGLSLNFAGTLPRSHLVFTDGGTLTLAFDLKEAKANPEFLRMTPEAFSFALTSEPRVLQFYAGGADLARAHILAGPFMAIDDSPTRVAAVHALGPEGGTLLWGDPRQMLETNPPLSDVIAISLLGSHGTSIAGAASLDPSFLLTVEGCSRVFDRLSSGGHALVTTWIENPPKSGVRLAALWIETLRRKGITEPAAHLIAMRSWSTLAIFIGRDPFPPATVEALRRFCADNSFDLVWFQGINAAETNLINVLPEEPYYEAFAGLLGGDARDYIERSPFAIDSPTDDRPFFDQSFRWVAVPQWMSSMGLSWLPFIEWGYILHVATLLVVTLLGLLLLVLPCIFTRARPTLRHATLFFSLGGAYMFVQIWAIYRLSQLIGQPLLAAALVLSAMLVASGAGAVLLRADAEVQGRRRFTLLLIALLVTGAIFPVLLAAVYPFPIWARGLAGVLWLVVPAFFMGFPFPYSLARLPRSSDVPWALALNGFGSVLGSLLATLVAVHFGFIALAASAVALYALTWLVADTA